MTYFMKMILCYYFIIHNLYIRIFLSASRGGGISFFWAVSPSDSEWTKTSTASRLFRLPRCSFKLGHAGSATSSPAPSPIAPDEEGVVINLPVGEQVPVPPQTTLWTKVVENYKGNGEEIVV